MYHTGLDLIEFLIIFLLISKGSKFDLPINMIFTIKLIFFYDVLILKTTLSNPLISLKRNHFLILINESIHFALLSYDYHISTYPSDSGI